MLPQNGGVPNFTLRISGPILTALILVMVSGTLLTLSFHLHTEPGDLAAQNKVKLSFIITVLLSAMLLIVGTERWWYAHLWNRGNSQKHHHHRKKHARANHSRR